MKRICFVVLALLLIFSSFALAEVDVNSMTDEELKQAYKDVMAELMDRKIWEESILPAGVYAVGKPLPEGSYYCTLKSKGTAYIFEDFDHVITNDWNEYIPLEEGQTFTLALYGDIVYLLKFDSYVHPFVGLDW